MNRTLLFRVISKISLDHIFYLFEYSTQLTVEDEKKERLCREFTFYPFSFFRSLDSPSNSTDAVNDISSKHHDDSDFETEAELPSLETFIPKDILKKLKPKEKKRQEVINGKMGIAFKSSC